MKSIRIACGAGFSGDRFEPAQLLAEKGDIDYLVFECLAERTIALAQNQKQHSPELGYDPYLERRFQGILPLMKLKRFKVLTNMGAANPLNAAQKVKQMAYDMGMDLKVGVVLGDDVLNLITGEEKVLETGEPLSLSGEIVSANAYLGIERMVEGLEKGADVIITGRVADPSLFLAPMVYSFGWNSPEMFGQGTVIGHLLECAGQLTGGYYMDAQHKKVPNPAYIGFPIAEVFASGKAIFSKVEETGGLINLATVKEQLLYEVLDPHAYFTPDVVANFTQVNLKDLGKNCVEVNGGTGVAASNFYKVSVGYKAHYLGEGEISYMGHNAVDRARLAEEILRERLKEASISEIRFDLLGCNAIYPQEANENLKEVRLRVAAKCSNAHTAQRVGEEVEALYTNGPAGGGGCRKFSKEVIGIHSILMPKDWVTHKVLIL